MPEINQSSILAQLVGAGVFGGGGASAQNSITKGANPLALGLTDVNAGQGLSLQGVSPMSKNVPILLQGMGKPTHPIGKLQEVLQGMGDAFLRSIANTGIQSAPVDTSMPILNALPKIFNGRGGLPDF